MKRNNISNLITIFNKVHNNKYDYSNSVYYNNRSKIEIICPIHGSFSQEPFNHLKGVGCPECSGNKKMNKESFTRKSKLIHGDRYDYSLVNYKNNSTCVKIICKKHGIFSQSPQSHLTGRGCHVCGGSQVLTSDEFERRSRLIHGNLYQYDMVDYKNAKSKVKIKCQKHGIFLQKPNNHLSGYGCLVCKSSKGESIIFNYLKNNNIDFVSEYYLNEINYYLDFYIPEYKLGIEYDGIQHFHPIEFFGGVESYLRTKERDKLKDKYCLSKNIKLYRISYLDIDKIEDILENLFKKLRI